MGRPKGSKNKSTLEVKALAQPYGKKAIKTLLAIMLDEKRAGAVRVAAARELLDRAYGRPPQAQTNADGTGPAEMVVRLLGDAADLAPKS